MSHSAIALLLVLVAGCGAGASKPSPLHPGEPAERDRAGELRLRLSAQRQLQIQRLHAYREAGMFPRQRAAPDQLINVLIDDDGHLCAIAHLMDQAGEAQLVRLTAAHSNHVQMAEVKDGPLLDWILGSGLTQEEVVAVQEPYVYDTRQPVARARERRRLEAHLAKIEAQLERDGETSLDLAVARLMAREARQARRAPR